MKWKPPLLPCAQYIVNFSRGCLCFNREDAGFGVWDTAR